MKSFDDVIAWCELPVTPRAGVWIEISPGLHIHPSPQSLPVRECGLKLEDTVNKTVITASLPVRECGLKYLLFYILLRCNLVTPRAGVWIEIASSLSAYPMALVTPRAGVWIEISSKTVEE